MIPEHQRRTASGKGLPTRSSLSCPCLASVCSKGFELPNSSLLFFRPVTAASSIHIHNTRWAELDAHGNLWQTCRHLYQEPYFSGFSRASGPPSFTHLFDGPCLIPSRMKITQGIEATSPPLFFLFFPPCMNRQIPAVLCADTTKGTVRPQRTTFESTGTPTVNAGQGVPASSITSSRHPFPLIRLQKISCVASLTPATKFNYDIRPPNT
ncbi:hypothetical protein IWX49DRAFT_47905 [Phyllosticta citricarpa]